MIDRHAQKMITININNKLINKYLHWVTPGTSIHIENFKINKKLDFERGDAEYYLQLTSKTKI